jgi:hypothetical protein
VKRDLTEDGREFVDSILTGEKKKETLVNFSRNYTTHDEEKDVQRYCENITSYGKYIN